MGNKKCGCKAIYSYRNQQQFSVVLSEYFSQMTTNDELNHAPPLRIDTRHNVVSIFTMQKPPQSMK